MTRRVEYLHCYDSGRKYYSARFVLFVCGRSPEGEQSAGSFRPIGEYALPWRLGMAVTRKTGSAVWRNRVRRLLREFFRLEQDRIPAGFDYVVVPKRNLEPRALTLAAIQTELTPVLRKVANCPVRNTSAD